jgi:hypothetical protein
MKIRCNMHHFHRITKTDCKRLGRKSVVGCLETGFGCQVSEWGTLIEESESLSIQPIIIAE